MPAYMRLEAISRAEDLTLVWTAPRPDDLLLPATSIKALAAPHSHAAQSAARELPSVHEEPLADEVLPEARSSKGPMEMSTRAAERPAVGSQREPMALSRDAAT